MCNGVVQEHRYKQKQARCATKPVENCVVNSNAKTLRWATFCTIITKLSQKDIKIVQGVLETQKFVKKSDKKRNGSIDIWRLWCII